MFGRIIVATDLTDATRPSLRVACELRHSEGEILLVHVIRPIDGVSDGELDGFYDRLRADAASRMRDLSSWFVRERHIDIPCLVAMGDPARGSTALPANQAPISSSCRTARRPRRSAASVTS